MNSLGKSVFKNLNINSQSLVIAREQSDRGNLMKISAYPI